MEKERRLIIIAEANGSGKSTIANELLSVGAKLSFVNADNIALVVFNDNIYKKFLEAANE